MTNSPSDPQDDDLAGAVPRNNDSSPADPLDQDLPSSQPPFFNPRQSASSYSGGAFVLAGFTFAAIVLLVTLEAAKPGLTYQRAVGALLTAFLGCVISAFLMALVAGQTNDRSTRTFWLALLASITLASSSLLALWGLADMVGAVFSKSGAVLTLVRVTFLAAVVLVVCFISSTGVDLLRVAHAKEKFGWLLLAQAAAVVLGVVVVLVLELSGGTSVYATATTQLGALTLAVVAALGLATFGRLEDWGHEVARWLTVPLVAYPTFLALILLGMLRS